MERPVTTIQRFAIEEDAATLAEYGLLLGLISIVAVLAVAAVGVDVFSSLDAAHQELGALPSPSVPTP